MDCGTLKNDPEPDDLHRFRSPGGRIRTLADLPTGMRVVVGADQTEVRLQARLILIGTR